MRLLVLLVSVVARVVPGRRAAVPPSQPAPSSPPLVSPLADPLPTSPLPRRTLALPAASPGYRDGLGPVAEPGRVRPYLVAAERRRAERVWQGLREELAEIARTVVEQPDPDPVPGPGSVPGPASAPRLPRRRPGEHAPPPEPDLYPPAPPAAAPAPPVPAAAAACSDPLSDATLQRILVRLRELDAQATVVQATPRATPEATPETAGVRSGGGW